ncbi:hypothetical protein [Acinetobacter schindleri]|uniref:hypothetical protein n=1 Tax=Acinetobacter schindleri TaxID=108981 RepID=UPI003D02E670
MELIRTEGESSATGIVTKRGHRVTAEAVQDIFLQFTAPKTSLGKSYNKNLEINYEEIQHLNSMILQLLKREHLLGINCSVVVIHMDKTRIVFDSFKQFNEYATGTSSPTHKVVLIYKYAIEYSETKEIQNYEVTIELLNKLSAYEELNSDQLPSAMKALLIRVMPVVEIHIKYEDYLKAKVILDGIDDWVNGCPHNSNGVNKFIRFLQNNSSTLPSIFATFSVLFIVNYLSNNISNLIEINANIRDIFVLSAQCLGISFIIIKIAKGVGDLVENFLDFYPFLSFININKGDSNLINNRKKNISAVIIKIIVTILLGALGSYVMAVICGLFPDLLPK